ncbi:MAG: tRNA (cytidine(34)-2'-O)-methyltransferase [Candidatus Delongbacteria bacterium]|nr:tRNA (cytidine(34)-2'-O)-methyltransferase [Candidatus Delongbacteria bacterium]MCG2760177.1 tRNA (cytidine(34)-2'-O)-methyltransferase [Candidatus Delongbacteria bacterium]
MKNHFLNIVLYQPEIPYNSGNIGRLCVGLNSKLHLIEPLGFKITDKMIKRAGLDYWDKLDYEIYRSIDDFFEKNSNPNFYFFTTKASKVYFDVKMSEGDFLIFGKESGGLPDFFHNKFRDKGLRIPMSDQIRSINLCNSVAIIMYEAYRQNLKLFE